MENDNEPSENDVEQQQQRQQERIEALAEVSAMEGYQTTTGRGNTNRVANDELLVNGGGDANQFQTTDESGVLVQQRFVEFFTSLYVDRNYLTWIDTTVGLYRTSKYCPDAMLHCNLHVVSHLLSSNIPIFQYSYVPPYKFGTSPDWEE